MDKKEFVSLIKQYCNDTIFLSFINDDHLAYIKLFAAGKEIIPWLLERLKDTIGHDCGTNVDRDNSPWLLIGLLSDITNDECFEGFLNEHAGKLDEVRMLILKWGEKKGLII